MQNNPLAAPADACSPAPDRAGTDAFARRPEWMVYLIALIVRFLLERLLAARSRRGGLPAWWNYRADLPSGSVEQLAASIRGEFGNAIAWTCRRRGIGPGHRDWPEISRAIVAYGGSLSGFRAGQPAAGLQWWENPAIVPGMIGESAATPAADTLALLMLRANDAASARPAPGVIGTDVAAGAGAGADAAAGAGADAADRYAPSAPQQKLHSCATTGPPTGPPLGVPIGALVGARAGPPDGPAIGVTTGPPIGPPFELSASPANGSPTDPPIGTPAGQRDFLAADLPCLNDRGRSTACPAVLIRGIFITI